ncbi:hypothetical protein DVH24_003460 [Malus domestica]|uniref:Uncharacterized protein n=1 Tax=Malus domestica TaxID=3750 RepID=A0A498ILV9_MALDO|nr:hypothetical protein DVH24_003460 [Malus domestica]
MIYGLKSRASHPFCDNQTAFHITANPVFYEWTRHNEIDFHFIIEGKIVTGFVPSTSHLADFFY